MIKARELCDEESIHIDGRARTHTENESLSSPSQTSACRLHLHALAVSNKQSFRKRSARLAAADILLCPSQRSQPQTSAIHANPGSPPAERHGFSATSASLTSQCFTDSSQLSAY